MSESNPITILSRLSDIIYRQIVELDRCSEQIDNLLDFMLDSQDDSKRDD